MAVDDPRVIWNIIGEPPESPWAYESRTGQEAPHSVYQAWRTWNTKEQALVEKAAESMSGQSTDEILQSLGYRNEPDRGKSMFARYNSGEKSNVLTNIASDAFNLAVSRGHMTWNPATGQYENIGGQGGNQYWDAKGRQVSGPSSGWGNMLVGRPTVDSVVAQRQMNPTWNTGGNMPGQATPAQPTGPKRGDAGYRPLLRTDPNNSNFGSWGAAYGRQQQIGSAARRPQNTNTFQYQPTGMGNPTL